MTTLRSEHYIDLVRAYETLTQSLTTLKHCLYQDEQHEYNFAWVQSDDYPHLAHLSHRERAYAIISALEYQEEQAPKETLICPGLIGASTETLEQIQKMNDAKIQFKTCILNLKKNKVNLKTEEFNHTFEINLPPRRDAETALALKRTGLARLHLKQCYRKIPLLLQAPLSISWTWAHTRAIKKMTVAEADAQLAKRADHPNIQQQRLKLAYLSPNEPLAIIQELAPHLRANLLWPNQTRSMIKAPLPIFFPIEPNSQPQFKIPSPKKNKDKNRAIRADQQIDPIPFLPTLRAHRYLTYSNAMPRVQSVSAEVTIEKVLEEET